MAYDTATSQLLLYGGKVGPEVRPRHLTWAWTGSTWSTLTTPVHPPNDDEGAAMAYDATSQQTVLFGAGSNPSNKTWVWSGSSWAQLFPARNPVPAAASALSYDAALGELVLFGGASDDSEHPVLNGTWLWDGTTWTRSPTATSPQPRWFAAMAYDAAQSELVLFGGMTADETVLEDTWVYTPGTGVPSSSTVRGFPAA